MATSWENASRAEPLAEHQALHPAGHIRGDLGLDQVDAGLQLDAGQRRLGLGLRGRGHQRARVAGRGGVEARLELEAGRVLVPARERVDRAHRPDGRQLAPIMPWLNFANLSDDDAAGEFRDRRDAAADHYRTAAYLDPTFAMPRLLGA